MPAFIMPAFAQNEIGPEGHKLVWVAVVIAVAGLLAFALMKAKSGSLHFGKPLFKRKKVRVELYKDRLYYPDALELTVTNTGNVDVDLDAPLLIFSSLWYSRKFRLKGTNNNRFYPLYLGVGQEHKLNIDLNRFYGFDKTLKRAPRVKIRVSEVTGKSLGHRKVLLRKTLFNV